MSSGWELPVEGKNHTVNIKRNGINSGSRDKTILSGTKKWYVGKCMVKGVTPVRTHQF